MGSTRLASVSTPPNASTRTARFYHPNHLGSTDLVTDGAGTQVAHYEYTPYGELFSTEGITVPHQYTGEERDPETGFYFYEARYYDPQLGRFITPDTFIPNWANPQDFNRYTYAGNNPLKYTDPTGHFSLKKFFKKFGGIAATAIGFLVPPLTPAMWALNIGLGLYQGLSSGGGIGQVLGGLAGGIIGGAAFGALGKGLALGLSNQMGLAAATFFGGALTGAIEFGVAGFGAGFGGALGAGAGFRDALKAGGAGAAVGAGYGAAIQGSYMAGWQDVAHGYSRSEAAVSGYGTTLSQKGLAAAEAYKQQMQAKFTRLAQGFSPIPAVKAVGGAIPHAGIAISRDPYGELNGSWGFNPDSSAPGFSWSKVLAGDTVPGVVTNDTFTVSVPTGLRGDQIRNVHAAIQRSIENPPPDNLYSHNCYCWRDETLSYAN